MGIPGLLQRFQLSGSYTGEPLNILPSGLEQIQRIQVKLQPGEILELRHVRWATQTFDEPLTLRITFLSNFQSSDGFFTAQSGDEEVVSPSISNNTLDELPGEVVISYQNDSDNSTVLLRPTGWWLEIIKRIDLP